MTNTNINFDKRKLESLKSSTKPIWYYAQNFEGLALVVGKKKKTYNYTKILLVQTSILIE